MMIQAAAALLLSVNPGGSGDTPTTPIDSTQIATYIASGDPAVEAVCSAYADVADATFALVAATGGDADDLTMMTELVDSYEILQLEGDTLRLTPEARLFFVTWLHTCS